MKKNDQKIKCDVETCKYNNCQKNCCTLEEILVSCDCDDPSCQRDTICGSFEKEKE